MNRMVLFLCAASLCAVFVVEAVSAQSLSRRRLELPPNALTTRAIQVVGAAVQAADAAPARQEVSISTRIQFAFDSARLTSAAQDQLSLIAMAINSPSARHARFLIEGHTDASGPELYNLSLSRRRAEAVLAFLISQGVSFDRLESIGYGEKRLLDGVPARDSAQRRVEFLVLR